MYKSPQPILCQGKSAFGKLNITSSSSSSSWTHMIYINAYIFTYDTNIPHNRHTYTYANRYSLCAGLSWFPMRHFVTALHTPEGFAITSTLFKFIAAKKRKRYHRLHSWLAIRKGVFSSLLRYLYIKYKVKKLLMLTHRILAHFTHTHIFALIN